MDNFDFRFSQCFGDKADIVVTEADIITATEFDSTGNFLATGDKGGRVVLFERSNSKHCEYKFLTEFQSHDAEFDYLKSLEIEEKINQIKWLRPVQKSHFLLSTNDKTIKLWKIYEKNIKLVSSNNLSEGFDIGMRQQKANAGPFVGGAGPGGDRSMKAVLSLQNLKLPQLSSHDKIIAATPKRIYSGAHAYHINSISPNSDQETFLSADDLRINLWNYDIPDQSFNIVDIKPANMEELTEVITSAEFHPQQCNLFMYSSSKGTVKLCDMRQNALCDNRATIFEEYTNPISHNFFTEITSSISDIKFSPNGRYIAARDYLTVKIWDIHMNNKPLRSISVHDQLKKRLSDTYENDAIFDKFEVEFSGDSRSIMTGSYNNNFMIYPHLIDLGDGDNSGSSGKSQLRFNGKAKRVHAGNRRSRTDADNDGSRGKRSTNRGIGATGGEEGEEDEGGEGEDELQSIESKGSGSGRRGKGRHGKKRGENDNRVNGNNRMDEDENEDGDGYDSHDEIGGGDPYEGSSRQQITEIVLQADKAAFRNKQLGAFSRRSTLTKDWGDNIDFKKSILHFSWHPRENSIAIAATNNLFIFSAL